MDVRLRDILVQVLIDHEGIMHPNQMYKCSCGNWSMYYGDLGISEIANEHRIHVAGIIEHGISKFLQ